MLLPSILETSLAVTLFTVSTYACAIPGHDSELHPPAAIREHEILQTRTNIERRTLHNRKHRPHKKTAIVNVSVFDGTTLKGPETIVIEDGRVSSCSQEDAEEVIDGTGHTLMPGLIDSHFHPANITHLQETTRNGVTSGVVMACNSPELCASLRGHDGLTNVVLSSYPGTTSDSLHGKIVGIDPTMALSNSSMADQWLDKQIAADAQLIKLIAEPSGLDQATLSAATAAAHERDRIVACHASDLNSVHQALIAGVDQVHHVPLDRELDSSAIAAYKANGTLSSPTLIMMRDTAKAIPQLNFTASMASTSALLAAGVPILAGTDSNAQAHAPASPPFGSAIHDELELLVEAGMSPVEALQSATSIPARIWGLHDRGRVAVGDVADLVLVEGNPVENISAIRQVKKVWVVGHAFEC